MRFGFDHRVKIAVAECSLLLEIEADIGKVVVAEWCAQQLAVCCCAFFR